ncbi:MAG: YlxR family protein [Clostridiales bacterium]|nr:YlxR family protein [Clostridiales bacterium]
MLKPKKIPQRQCVGCRTMRDKRELLRIVKSPEGEISLDTTGKKSGRGAYVCPDPECLKKARKSRALERAFDMSIPDPVYDALEEQMRG